MVPKHPILIVKADGNRVPYDEGKLRRSLSHAGAKEDVVERITREVEKELYDGMTTHDIYRKAFALLEKERKPVAAHYSMKRAILALGPSGYPFEQFVAEIFRRKGYEAAVGVEVRGLCARHEVDVAAKLAGKCIGAELKFHNRTGGKSDIKDALYVRARFDDIIHFQEKNPGGNDPCITEGWFITNTNLTKHAKAYGRCTGLTMISWSYPRGGGLEDMINETGLQPITALTSLSTKEKADLLSQNVVLCRNVHEKADVLLLIGMEAGRIDHAIEEARAVCGIG